jgi:alkylhydroperoxidase family enzyme
MCHVHSAAFTPQEQALLAFVDKVTRTSHAVHRGDVERLIETGWSELQIAEAIHITALFAAFNRIVNAFGLSSQRLLDLYQTPDGNGRVVSANEPNNSE